MEKHLLEIVGITYNQIESGVYAVILKEAEGNRRIPIVIGYPEAQAIECKLQEIVTPRPLTHDMVLDMMEKFGIKLSEVLIRRLPSGVFVADIYCEKGRSKRIIDSRSSDAIALALRANAPIYTTEDVLAEAGVDPDSQREAVQGSEDAKKAFKMPDMMKIGPKPRPRRTKTKIIEDLEKEMEAAAAEERYEEAAKLKQRIDELRNGPKKNEES